MTFKFKTFFYKLIALAIAVTFSATSVYAAPLAPQIPAPAAINFPLSLQKISVPEEFGSVQEVQDSGKDRPLIFYIQDAHGIQDAQQNIQNLIGFLQNKYGVSVIGLEGARDQVDATLLREFPDKFVKEKVMREYLQRGEISGADLAAVMNPQPVRIHGIEDWPLYQENYAAYVQAGINQAEILKFLDELKMEADGKRRFIYSLDLNRFHEKVDLFNEEKSGILELIKFLSELEEKVPESEKLISEAKTPHLLKLMTAVKADQGRPQDLDVSIRQMSEKFRKNFFKRLRLDKQREFNKQYQNYVTGIAEPGTYLKFLTELAREIGIKPKLSMGMRELLGQVETFSMIKGTRLFDELSTVLLQWQAALTVKPEEKELAKTFDRLRMLKALAKLELTREQLDEYKQDSEAHLAVLGEKKELLTPATEFYRAALDRDDAFMIKVKEILKKEKTNAMMVLTGGFHAEGMRRNLKADNWSYAVITPKINSLEGQEAYKNAMTGRLSYREYLKKSFYDAFMQHASLQLVRDYNEPEFKQNVKVWRDSVIRDLASRGKIEKAGEYTSYIDSLIAVYKEKYGDQIRIEKTKDEILKSIEAELDKFSEEKIKSVTQKLEAGLPASGLAALEALANKRKDKLISFRSEGNLNVLLRRAPKFKLPVRSEVRAVKGEMSLDAAKPNVDVHWRDMSQVQQEWFKTELEEETTALSKVKAGQISGKISKSQIPLPRDLLSRRSELRKAAEDGESSNLRQAMDGEREKARTKRVLSNTLSPTRLVIMSSGLETTLKKILSAEEAYYAYRIKNLRTEAEYGAIKKELEDLKSQIAEERDTHRTIIIGVRDNYEPEMRNNNKFIEQNAPHFKQYEPYLKALDALLASLAPARQRLEETPVPVPAVSAPAAAEKVKLTVRGPQGAAIAKEDMGIFQKIIWGTSRGGDNLLRDYRGKIEKIAVQIIGDLAPEWSDVSSRRYHFSLKLKDGTEKSFIIVYDRDPATDETVFKSFEPYTDLQENIKRGIQALKADKQISKSTDIVSSVTPAEVKSRAVIRAAQIPVEAQDASRSIQYFGLMQEASLKYDSLLYAPGMLVPSLIWENEGEKKRLVEGLSKKTGYDLVPRFERSIDAGGQEVMFIVFERGQPLKRSEMRADEDLKRDKLIAPFGEKPFTLFEMGKVYAKDMLGVLLKGGSETGAMIGYWTVFFLLARVGFFTLFPALVAVGLLSIFLVGGFVISFAINYFKGAIARDDGAERNRLLISVAAASAFLFAFGGGAVFTFSSVLLGGVLPLLLHSAPYFFEYLNRAPEQGDARYYEPEGPVRKLSRPRDAKGRPFDSKNIRQILYQIALLGEKGEVEKINSKINELLRLKIRTILEGASAGEVLRRIDEVLAVIERVPYLGSQKRDERFGDVIGEFYKAAYDYLNKQKFQTLESRSAVLKFLEDVPIALAQRSQRFLSNLNNDNDPIKQKQAQDHIVKLLLQFATDASPGQIKKLEELSKHAKMDIRTGVIFWDQAFYIQKLLKMSGVFLYSGLYGAAFSFGAHKDHEEKLKTINHERDHYIAHITSLHGDTDDQDSSIRLLDEILASLNDISSKADWTDKRNLVPYLYSKSYFEQGSSFRLAAKYSAETKGNGESSTPVQTLAQYGWKTYLILERLKASGFTKAELEVLGRNFLSSDKGVFQFVGDLEDVLYAKKRNKGLQKARELLELAKIEDKADSNLKKFLRRGGELERQTVELGFVLPPDFAQKITDRALTSVSLQYAGRRANADFESVAALLTSKNRKLAKKGQKKQVLEQLSRDIEEFSRTMDLLIKRMSSSGKATPQAMEYLKRLRKLGLDQLKQEVSKRLYPSARSEMRVSFAEGKKSIDDHWAKLSYDHQVGLVDILNKFEGKVLDKADQNSIRREMYKAKIGKEILFKKGSAEATSGEVILGVLINTAINPSNRRKLLTYTKSLSQGEEKDEAAPAVAWETEFRKTHPEIEILTDFKEEGTPVFTEKTKEAFLNRIRVKEWQNIRDAKIWPLGLQDDLEEKMIAATDPRWGEIGRVLRRYEELDWMLDGADQKLKTEVEKALDITGIAYDEEKQQGLLRALEYLKRLASAGRRLNVEESRRHRIGEHPLMSHDEIESGGLPTAVLEATFSPDGKNYAVGHADNVIALEMNTDREIWRKEHIGIQSVKYSPDGSKVLSAGIDRRVIMWDAKTGNQLWRTFPGDSAQGHTSRIHKAAFSPAGNIVVTAGGDGRIVAWDAETGEQIWRTKPKNAGEYPIDFGSLDFAPDGTKIVTGGSHQRVTMLDATTGDDLWSIVAHEARYASVAVAFSLDGKKVVSGGGDRRVRMWNAEDGSPIWDTEQGGQTQGHEYQINEVAISPNGRLVGTVSGDRRVVLWDAATGRQMWRGQIQRSPGETGLVAPVVSIAFSPDGRYFATTDAAARVVFWKLSMILSEAQATTASARSELRATFAEGKKNIDDHWAKLSYDHQVWLGDILNKFEGTVLDKANRDSIRREMYKAKIGKEILFKKGSAEATSGEVILGVLINTAITSSNRRKLLAHAKSLRQEEGPSEIKPYEKKPDAQAWEDLAKAKYPTLGSWQDMEAGEEIRPVFDTNSLADFIERILAVKWRHIEPPGELGFKDDWLYEQQLSAGDPQWGILARVLMSCEELDWMLEGADDELKKLIRNGLRHLPFDYEEGGQKAFKYLEYLKRIASMGRQLDASPSQLNSPIALPSESEGLFLLPRFEMIRFSMNGKFFVTIERVGALWAARGWDMAEKREIWRHSFPAEVTITSVDFTQDNKQIAVSTSTGDVFIDAQTGVEAQKPSLKRLSRVKSRHIIAVAGREYRAQPTVNNVSILAVQSHSVSPDFKSLITVEDRHIVKTDENTGQELWTINRSENPRLYGHRYAISLVTHSPDGKWLVTTGFDSSIVIRHAGTGHPVWQLDQTGHNQIITVIGFAPDGRSFFTLDAVGQLISWQLRMVAPDAQATPAAPTAPSARSEMRVSEKAENIYKADLKQKVLNMKKDHKNEAQILANELPRLFADKDFSPFFDDFFGRVVDSSRKLKGGMIKGPANDLGREIARAILRSEDGRRRPKERVDELIELVRKEFEKPERRESLDFDAWVSRLQSAYPDLAPQRDKEKDNLLLLEPESDEEARLAIAGWQRLDKVKMLVAADFVKDNPRNRDQFFSVVSTLNIIDRMLEGAERDERLKEMLEEGLSYFLADEGKGIVFGNGSFQSDDSALAYLLNVFDALIEPFEAARELGALNNRNAAAGHTDRLINIAFSPNNKMAATVSADHRIGLWDLEAEDTPPRFLSGHTFAVMLAAFSPDGKKLVTGSVDGTIRVWDLQSGAASLRINGYQGLKGDALFFSADGTRITLIKSTNIYIFNAQSGDIISNFPIKDGFIYGASLDGQMLAITFPFNGDIRLLDGEGKKELKTLKGHKAQPSYIIISPDKKRLVSEEDNAIWIWDIETGERVNVLNEHTESISALAYSSDGSSFVSTSRDRTVRVWNAYNGRELHNFNLGEEMPSIANLALSRDGKKIGVALLNTSARILTYGYRRKTAPGSTAAPAARSEMRVSAQPRVQYEKTFVFPRGAKGDVAIRVVLENGIVSTTVVMGKARQKMDGIGVRNGSEIVIGSSASRSQIVIASDALSPEAIKLRFKTNPVTGELSVTYEIVSEDLVKDLYGRSLERDKEIKVPMTLRFTEGAAVEISKDGNSIGFLRVNPVAGAPEFVAGATGQSLPAEVLFPGQGLFGGEGSNNDYVLPGLPAGSNEVYGRIALSGRDIVLKVSDKIRIAGLEMPGESFHIRFEGAEFNLPELPPINEVVAKLETAGKDKLRTKFKRLDSLRLQVESYLQKGYLLSAKQLVRDTFLAMEADAFLSSQFFRDAFMKNPIYAYAYALKLYSTSTGQRTGKLEVSSIRENIRENDGARARKYQAENEEARLQLLALLKKDESVIEQLYEIRKYLGLKGLEFPALKNARDGEAELGIKYGAVLGQIMFNLYGVRIMSDKEKTVEPLMAFFEMIKSHELYFGLVPFARSEMRSRPKGPAEVAAVVGRDGYEVSYEKTFRIPAGQGEVTLTATLVKDKLTLKSSDGRVENTMPVLVADGNEIVIGSAVASQVRFNGISERAMKLRFRVDPETGELKMFYEILSTVPVLDVSGKRLKTGKPVAVAATLEFSKEALIVFSSGGENFTGFRINSLTNMPEFIGLDGAESILLGSALIPGPNNFGSDYERDFFTFSELPAQAYGSIGVATNGEIVLKAAGINVAGRKIPAEGMRIRFTGTKIEMPDLPRLSEALTNLPEVGVVDFNDRYRELMNIRIEAMKIIQEGKGSVSDAAAFIKAGLDQFGRYNESIIQTQSFQAAVRQNVFYALAYASAVYYQAAVLEGRGKTIQRDRVPQVVPSRLPIAGEEEKRETITVNFEGLEKNEVVAGDVALIRRAVKSSEAGMEKLRKIMRTKPTVSVRIEGEQKPTYWNLVQDRLYTLTLTLPDGSIYTARVSYKRSDETGEFAVAEVKIIAKSRSELRERSADLAAIRVAFASAKDEAMNALEAPTLEEFLKRVNGANFEKTMTSAYREGPLTAIVSLDDINSVVVIIRGIPYGFFDQAVAMLEGGQIDPQLLAAYNSTLDKLIAAKLEPGQTLVLALENKDLRIAAKAVDAIQDKADRFIIMAEDLKAMNPREFKPANKRFIKLNENSLAEALAEVDEEERNKFGTEAALVSSIMAEIRKLSAETTGRLVSAPVAAISDEQMQLALMKTAIYVSLLLRQLGEARRSELQKNPEGFRTFLIENGLETVAGSLQYGTLGSGIDPALFMAVFKAVATAA